MERNECLDTDLLTSGSGCLLAHRRGRRRRGSLDRDARVAGFRAEQAGDRRASCAPRAQAMPEERNSARTLRQSAAPDSEERPGAARSASIFTTRPDVIKILREEATRTGSLPGPSEAASAQTRTAGTPGPAESRKTRGTFWSWATGAVFVVSAALAALGLLFAYSTELAERFPSYAPEIEAFASEAARLRASVFEAAAPLLGGQGPES